MTLEDAIERLYALKVDTTTRDGDGTPHEKPHKPLLLLAAVAGASGSSLSVAGASRSPRPVGGSPRPVDGPPRLVGGSRPSPEHLVYPDWSAAPATPSASAATKASP